MMSQYLQASPLLDVGHPEIQRLIEKRQWRLLNGSAQIKAVYNFVRDEIVLGYNVRDDLQASVVLADGYGQCNTKAILLMTLFRATGHLCRLKAAWVDKRLQAGVIPPLVYAFSPARILHTWVEIQHGSRWIGLEGVVVDRPFLTSVQSANEGCQGAFCGLAIATPRLDDPPIEWRGSDTHIQHTAIVEEIGTFDMPDDLYARHRQALSPIRRFLFEWVVRHWMNRRVAAIRRGKLMPRLLGEAIEAEYRLAEAKETDGQPIAAFGHLERAHILSQRYTIAHVRSHLRMWAWAWRQRHWRELTGQSIRILAAAMFSRIWVPEGNTGGANVSAFRTMPIPDDLRDLMSR